ncbi:MAG TPA: hypothetical protein VFO08_14575 [Methylomirabilota bacterium]|nr:hypothetical protein [Methylomirabilota bacterium]
MELTEAPIGPDRRSFIGTPDQIAADVAATRALGAAELLFDVQFSPGVETAADILARLEQLQEIAHRA